MRKTLLSSRRISALLVALRDAQSAGLTPDDIADLFEIAGNLDGFAAANIQITAKFIRPVLAPGASGSIRTAFRNHGTSVSRFSADLHAVLATQPARVRHFTDGLFDGSDPDLSGVSPENSTD